MRHTRNATLPCLTVPCLTVAIRSVLRYHSLDLLLGIAGRSKKVKPVCCTALQCSCTVVHRHCAN